MRVGVHFSQRKHDFRPKLPKSCDYAGVIIPPHPPPLIRLVSCINCVLRAMTGAGGWGGERNANSPRDLPHTWSLQLSQSSHPTERKSDPEIRIVGFQDSGSTDTRSSDGGMEGGRGEKKKAEGANGGKSGNGLNVRLVCMYS